MNRFAAPEEQAGDDRMGDTAWPVEPLPITNSAAVLSRPRQLPAALQHSNCGSESSWFAITLGVHWLTITADNGGSNGPRVRLWKWELQRRPINSASRSASITCRLASASGTRSSTACSVHQHEFARQATARLSGDRRLTPRLRLLLDIRPDYFNIGAVNRAYRALAAPASVSCSVLERSMLVLDGA